MAKQIIVQRVTQGPGGDRNVSYLLWLAVTSGREVPIAGAVSQWSGASAAENTAIAAGQVIEEPGAAQYQTGQSKVSIEADLVARFNAQQSEITARPNPNQFFGLFFDSSTGWSA